jgi:hypothetical protein
MARSISISQYIRETLPLKRIETICKNLGIQNIGDGHLCDNDTQVVVTDAGEVISVGGQKVAHVEIDQPEEVEVVPDAPDDGESEDDPPKPKKSRKKAVPAEELSE